jgi:hypothetical protein
VHRIRTKHGAKYKNTKLNVKVFNQNSVLLRKLKIIRGKESQRYLIPVASQSRSLVVSYLEFQTGFAA